MLYFALCMFFLFGKSNRETELKRQKGIKKVVEKQIFRTIHNTICDDELFGFACKHKVKSRAIKFSQTLLFCVLFSLSLTHSVAI